MRKSVPQLLSFPAPSPPGRLSLQMQSCCPLPARALPRTQTLSAYEAQCLERTTATKMSKEIPLTHPVHGRRKRGEAWSGWLFPIENWPLELWSRLASYSSAEQPPSWKVASAWRSWTRTLCVWCLKPPAKVNITRLAPMPRKLLHVCSSRAEDDEDS